MTMIDRDELLKHEVMIINKANAAFHGVPSSLIEKAPVIDLKNLQPVWRDPETDPPKGSKPKCWCWLTVGKDTALWQENRFRFIEELMKLYGFVLLAGGHCIDGLSEHSGVYAFRAVGMEKRVDGAEDTYGVHTGICRTGRRSWVHDGVSGAQNDRFCMIDTKFTLYHFSA